jgi:long-chain fatty acid transport protein
VVGAALFSPIRKYETTAPPPSFPPGAGGRFTIGPNKLKSSHNYFVIPHLSKSWQLSNDSAWALSFYGRGGMNTEWNGGTATFDPDGPLPGFGVMTLDGTYGAGRAGVNFSQAFLDITWAKKINDQFSLGISAVLAAQMFEASGVGSFAGFTETFWKGVFGQGVFDTVPQNLSNNGVDWGFGAGVKVGLHAPLSDAFSFGVSYQSKIYMSEFDDYADLFARQGDFDIPPMLKLGVTFHANETLALSFDLERIWYSDIDAVGNSIAKIFACPGAMQGGTDLSSCLGGENGAGFGWEDMTVYKAGLAWSNGDDWTLRFGYSYGKQPIPESQITFNILAPGVMESHITAGFTKNMAPDRELNVAAMYAPTKKVTGPQNFDPTQNVTLQMYEWELEVSYGWKF